MQWVDYVITEYNPSENNATEILNAAKEVMNHEMKIKWREGDDTLHQHSSHLRCGGF